MKDCQVLIFHAHLSADGSFGHQLGRQLIFNVPGVGVRPASHQQPRRLHLALVILQRADDVQGRVSAERLKRHRRGIGAQFAHLTDLVTTEQPTLTFTMDTDDGWSRNMLSSSTLASSEAM